MRKRISALLASLLVVALLVLVACSNGAPQVSSAASGASSATSAVSNKHVIGVAVYNTADDEVLMFRDYLMNYIAAVAFEDVQFVYSNSLRSEEELLSFIDLARQTPSGGNLQPLRYRLVTDARETAAVQALSRWGAALPELHLPFPGTEAPAWSSQTFSTETLTLPGV